jgi:exodeoxyribonuclease V beta subunit
MESLHNLDINSLDDAYMLLKNSFGFKLNKQSLDDIKQTTIRTLQNKDFINLIKNKNIQKEVQFKYKKQIGIIDLLLEDKDNIYIIDYKTSSSTNIQEYLEQINFYKNAMSHIYNKPSYGYLFFINEQKLIKIDT